MNTIRSILKQKSFTLKHCTQALVHVNKATSIQHLPLGMSFNQNIGFRQGYCVCVCLNSLNCRLAILKCTILAWLPDHHPLSILLKITRHICISTMFISTQWLAALLQNDPGSIQRHATTGERFATSTE